MTQVLEMPTTVTAVRFIARPLATDFARRVRAGGPDDFGRPGRHVIAQGGEPVRDQLRRVEPGTRLILCAYQAVPMASAFAEVGPVYVSAEEPKANDWRDELPPGYFNRTFALRAYNRADEIIESTLVEPDVAPEKIRAWLARPEVAYLHARFAGHGCYACRFDRA
jgi:Protein of unknown function (DUF1203)